jgi:hypothetical protein
MARYLNIHVYKSMSTFTHTIDKTTRGVMRKPLEPSEKEFINKSLLHLIESKTIRVNYARVNSGVGRTQVFGYGNRRGLGFGEFKNNLENQDLYRMLVQLGAMVVPPFIPWTAIQVNHNYQTSKHIDGNNIGLSYSVSFGDFTGGELVVAGEPFQTRLTPIIFNGALNDHFNQPITGNRYSLVYFVSAPSQATDQQIFQLHEQLIQKNTKTVGRGLALSNMVKKGENVFQNLTPLRSQFFSDSGDFSHTNS